MTTGEEVMEKRTVKKMRASFEDKVRKLDTHAFYPATESLQNCKLLLIWQKICTVEHHVITLLGVHG